MNSLNDLRTTLDAHAEQVPDDEAVVRATAVRHRIAGVRRRRRAVGASALAVVLAGTVGVLGLQRAASDPAPVVFGVRAPATITSLGYTYRAEGWARTVDGTGSVHIGASDRPRLISWTVQDTPSVRFVLPDGEIWRSSVSRFGDFVQIPSGQSGTLKVAAGDGAAGFASYVLTDAAPPGYTKDGITFRRTVADTPLLGAVINDLGQTDVTMSYVLPRGQESVHEFCVGLPKGDAVHVSVNGHERLAGDCNDLETFDPGTGSSYSFQVAHPGRTVSLRLWVSHGVKSPTPLPAGSAPHLRMGAGVYGPLATTSLGGYHVDDVVEHDGHTWQLTARHESADGSPLRFGPVATQMAATMAWHVRSTDAEVSFAADGMTAAGGRFPHGRGGIGDLWVPAGAVVHASFVHGRGSFAVALYRRTD